MEAQDIVSPDAVVEVVDVLCDEGHVRVTMAPVGEDLMTDVGLATFDEAATSASEVPDSAGVLFECSLGGEAFGVVGFPEASAVAIGWNSAEGRQASAGEDSDFLSAVHRLGDLDNSLGIVHVASPLLTAHF